MFNEKIPSGRLWAWVMVAASAPVTCIYGGGWLFVLVMAGICGLISYCVQKVCQEGRKKNRVLCAVQWLWIGVLLGNLAGYSAFVWDDGNAYPVVPLVLLALAAFASRSGAEKASRAGATLFWFVAVIFVLVLGAGMKELKTEWMKPEWTESQLLMVPVFLLPCVTVLIPRENRKRSLLTSLGVAVPAVLVAFWLDAFLSPAVASQKVNPFYEYSKSISLFGVAERFEALVSCVMTVGWFGLFSLLFSAAGSQLEEVKPKWGTAGVWFCAGVAAVVLLCELHISSFWTAILSLVFWGVTPILEQGIERIKKS